MFGENLTNQYLAEEIIPSQIKWKLKLMAGDYNAPYLDRIADCLPDDLTEENAWMAREAIRIVELDYTLPAFVHEDWFLHSPDAVILTFPHVSVEKEAMVAYTPDNEKGQKDQQVRSKVGRYFSKVVKKHMEIDHKTVERVSREHRLYFDPPEVQWAVNGEEIQWVYENGPESCMSKSEDDMVSHVHPTVIYGQDYGSDLCVAYITRDNKPNARAVVRESESAFMLFYGDSTLKEQLKDLGYRHDSEAFIGAKVGRIENVGSPGFVSPYIGKDGEDQAFSLKDEGSHFVLTEDEGVTPHSQNGIVTILTCDHCGDHVSDEDDLVEVYEEGHWCRDCTDLHCVQAETRFGFETVPAGHPTLVEVDNGDIFLDEQEAERCGWLQCEKCDEWHHEGDMVVTEDTDENIHKDEIDHVLKDSNGETRPLANAPSEGEATDARSSRFPNAAIYVETEQETA